MKPGSARILALGAHIALIAGLLAWSPTKLGALAALVLLAPLPGLWRGKSYTYGWASMMLATYAPFLLADGVARPDGRMAAFALGALATIEFVVLVLYVRLNARARSAQTAGSASASG
ncbi:MAG TPA: DUF2069 domain-containing protein [Solimonas sp.]|nr:DUF2069 domain-containing protein [Solimonas sp.]